MWAERLSDALSDRRLNLESGSGGGDICFDLEKESKCSQPVPRMYVQKLNCNSFNSKERRLSQKCKMAV